MSGSRRLSYGDLCVENLVKGRRSAICKRDSRREFKRRRRLQWWHGRERVREGEQRRRSGEE